MKNNLLVFLFVMQVVFVNAQLSTQLMSAITISPNPVPSGSYVTISASIKNNGASSTFDFECDLETTSGGFITVVKKTCSVSINSGATQSVTFPPVSPGGYINASPGSYKIHLIALFSSCFQCGNTGCTSSTVLPGSYVNPLPIIVTSAYCGGTTNLTSCSGGFSDGSGSNTYCNNSNCSWLIQPADASSITLSFSAFDVESNWDVVNVYNGTNATFPLLGSFSGSTIPGSVTSGSAMFVVFTSDAATVKQGWSANYSCVAGSCTAPTNASSTPATINCGQSSSLTVTPASPGSGCIWKWYSGSCGGTYVNSGSSISVTPGATTVYYVRAEGSGGNTSCLTTIVTVNGGCSSPISATALPSTINSGQTSTLSVTPTSPGSGCTWKWYSGSCGGSSVGSGSLITVNPTLTTTYYVRAEGSCGNTSCVNTTVTVNGSCTSPSSASASPASITSGQSSVLTVTPSSPGSGCTWKWYSNSCGGTYIGSGSSLSVSPIATTTYYVRAEGSGGNTLCTSVSVTVTGSLCPSSSDLIICADNISGTGPYIASGNGTISPTGCSSPVLNFSNGNFVIGPSTLIGTGNLYLDNILGSNVSLNSGAFSYSVNGIRMTSSVAVGSNWLLKLAGLKTQLNANNYFDVECDKVTFPILPLELPNILKDANKNTLIPNIYMEIAQSTGYGMGADISIDKKIKLKNILDIDELHLSFFFSQTQQRFEGAIKLKTWLYSIDGDAKIINSQLDAIHFAYESQFGIPIGTTGLRFIKFGGGVSNLTSFHDVEIEALTQIMTTGIPRKTLRGELSFKYKIGTSFTAAGTLYTFDDPSVNAFFSFFTDKLEVGGDFNFKDILKGNADFTLTYNSRFSGIFNLGFYFPDITTPTFVAKTLKHIFPPGSTIGESKNFLLISNDDKYISGFVRTNICFFLPTLYYELEWNGTQLIPSFGTNYNILPSEAISAIGYSMTNLSRRFTLDASTKSLVIEAQNTGSIPQYEIYLPNGDTVSAANHDLFDNIAYFEDNTTNYSCFNLFNPVNGNYYIHLTNVDTSTLKIYRANVPPMIRIKSVVKNGTTYQIKYNPSDPEHDAKIRFGLDDDKNGANGLIIADSITAGNDSVYTWNSLTKPVSHGKYYLYAMIENASHQFFVTYYPDPITIIGQSGLNPPGNLTVSSNDTSIILSFVRTEPFPFNNILYYSNDANSVNFHCPSIAIGDTSDVGEMVVHYLTNFIPGKYYEFFLTTIDTLFNESEPSNIVSLTWHSTSQNNSPHIISGVYPAIAYSGVTYSCQIQGVDPDNDPLSYDILIARPSDSVRIIVNPLDTISPVDTVLVMDTISHFTNNTGLISWIPGNDDIGCAQVYVKMSDGILQDSVSYPVRIFDYQTSSAFIDFSKVYYVDYNDKPLVSITDPDFTGSTQITDSVQIRVYSNSDHTGFYLQAHETQPSSNNFVSRFDLTASTTSNQRLKVSKGDTIWSEFSDPTQQKFVRDYSYFTIFNADFFIPKDTICSGENLFFKNASTGDHITHYKWLLGNNDTASTRNAQKTFTVPKGAGFQRIDITLIIKNYENKVDTITKPIYIARPVNLGNDTTVCGSMLLGVYNPSNPPVSYLWSTGQTTPNIIITTTGNYSVTVTDNFNCISSDTIHVTVNPVPVPTIAGNNSVCKGTAGVEYETESGMSGYIWAISTGGTITTGTGTNSIIVTWHSSGAQWVSITYTNTFGCPAKTPTIKNITVKPLPVITLIGPSPMCANTAKCIYTTQPLKSNYVWTVSPGGTITAGGTSTANTVVVTWLTAGTDSVTVNYTEPSTGCAAAFPTAKMVIVNPLPTPTIKGPTQLCAGSYGNYETETGMSNYKWKFSTGAVVLGSISGSSVNVKWNTTGINRWVSVNYKNANGCTAAVPTVFSNITVNPLPVITISGKTSACESDSGVIYSTQAGMSCYIWKISAGNKILTGDGTNSITVKWNKTGKQWVGVNYKNSFGCSATTPKIYYVTVKAATVPYIWGPVKLCFNNVVNYETNHSKKNYQWVAIGGNIIAGQGTHFVTVHWTSIGQDTIQINFTEPQSCPVLQPTKKVVTIYPLPVPQISGDTSVTINVYKYYTTEANMTNYDWKLEPDGTIKSGFGTRQIKVIWSLAGLKKVKVKYAQYGCMALNYTTKNVIVVPNQAPSMIVPIKPIDTMIIPVSNLENNTNLMGVENLNDSLNVDIFPIPSDGVFYVIISCSSNDSFTIRVYDLKGILIDEKKLTGFGKLKTDFNLTYLSQGVYIVVVANKNKQIVRKILIR